MSFVSAENSVYGGSPVELYHFVCGLREWRFTSHRKDVDVNTRIFKAIPLQRTNVEQNREFAKTAVSITIPAWNLMALAFLVNPPEGLVTVTISRYHAGDGEMATYWKGRVSNVQLSDGRAIVKCEPVYTALQGQGRRRSYSTQCTHTLYKQGCRVNDQAFKAEGNLTGGSGLTLSAAEIGTAPAGYFNGGKVVVWLNDEPYNRQITSHSGSQITIISPIPGLQSNALYQAYPGCDHTLQMCDTRFGNSANFGGFPWKPIKNPFQGDSPF